jgi:phage host-nuclease inhibitor protein Gam
MKLIKILKENIEDDLLDKGFIRKPSQIDINTGKVTDNVTYAINFKSVIKKLYDIYNEIKKYKTSSNEKISELSTIITKEISHLVKDVQYLEDYIKLSNTGIK